MVICRKFICKILYCQQFKLNAKRSASNNIAIETVNAWKQSPGHNENLLLKTATYVGIHTMITKNNILIVTYVTYSFS